MLLFRLNIALSHFNRVNRFFKEKSKALCLQKIIIKKPYPPPPCHRVSKPFFIWGGVEAGQKILL